MKKNFSIVLIILLEALYSCSSDKANNISTIDPGKLIEKEIMLSEIADDIQYIPLDNEILIKGIVRLELSDHSIFISPVLEDLIAYNLKGKLIHQIGERGRGPGEYKYNFMFTLDQGHKMIYILDRTRILKYTMDGRFIREIPIRSKVHFSNITFLDDKLYLYEGINLGYGEYDWVTTDTLGNILSGKINPIKDFSSFHFCNGSKQEAFNNTIYYWNQINDTIFKIEDDKYYPAFLFAHGNFRFPKSKEMDISKYFYPSQIFFTKDFLIFTYSYQSFNCTGIYKKSNQQFYAVNKIKDRSAVFGPGIINDLDGGLPLVPESYYCNEKQDEFLVGEINPFQLKAYVVSDEFKGSTPRYPEKKKELEKLANSLSENDNPVLMLVRLKK